MITNSGWRYRAIGLVAAIGAATGLAGVGLAQSGHAVHGSGHGAMTAMDPAAMDAHIDKMFAEMLPDGTAEQRSRLKTIARAIHADVGTVHGQIGKSHERMHDLLLRPTIDRAALEAIRVEQVEQIDAVSKRLVNEFADAADVLTPQQRARLAARHQAKN
jgi:Spy/CpxP family protein refolding chaperone